MSKRSYSFLWALTGFVALGLLIATINLTMKAKAYADNVVEAYISSSKPSVYMRQSPGEHSKIVAILKSGAKVQLKNASTEGENGWYRVDFEEFSGWIPAEYISLTAP